MTKRLLLIIIILVLTSCSGGMDPLTVEDSSDGSKQAMAYVYRLDDSNTYVTIESKSNRININNEHLELKGLVAVGFKWLSNTELNVLIPEKATVEKLITEINGVAVHIVRDQQ